jgi:hypothetical protein
MEGPDLIPTLQKFGMTEREAKLYLAMLEKYETTAAELHRISGVLRTKTYETLEKMVSKGYCMERVENRKRYYKVVKPSQLQKMFYSQWDSEQAWRKETAQEIFTSLEKRFDKRPVNLSLDFIEVLHSKDQIHQRFLSELSNSQTEMCSFIRSPYACLDPDVLEEQERVYWERLEHGLKCTPIYMREDVHWEWLDKHVVKMRAAGGDVRITERLPMKMYIFDRKRVMLALPAIPGHTEADFTMLVVEDPGFTESCQILFDGFWAKSLTPEKWKAQMIN